MEVFAVWAKVFGCKILKNPQASLPSWEDFNIRSTFDSLDPKRFWDPKISWTPVIEKDPWWKNIVIFSFLGFVSCKEYQHLKRFSLQKNHEFHQEGSIFCRIPLPKNLPFTYVYVSRLDKVIIPKTRTPPKKTSLPPPF